MDQPLSANNKDSDGWIRGGLQIRECSPSSLGLFYAGLGTRSWKLACCSISEFGNWNHIINKILYFENSYSRILLLSSVASWQTSDDQIWASTPVPGNSKQIRTGTWNIFRSIRDSSVADHSRLPRDVVVGDVRCCGGIL